MLDGTKDEETGRAHKEASIETLCRKIAARTLRGGFRVLDIPIEASEEDLERELAFPKTKGTKF